MINSDWIIIIIWKTLEVLTTETLIDISIIALRSLIDTNQIIKGTNLRINSIIVLSFTTKIQTV